MVAIQASTGEIKATIRDYWQRRSDTYDRFPISASEEEERAICMRALRKVLNGDGLRVLDVGTGTGYLVSMFAEMGHEAVGLDLTEGMMEKARERAQASGHAIQFELGDAENLPFEDASFDVVACRYCLWTLPDPEKALAEWARVTKPGGQILAIEGLWRDSSLLGRLRRLSKQLGILIYERANPWQLRYGKDTDALLPFRDGISAERATDIFHGLGLANVFVHTLREIRDLQSRNMPFFYRMALSPPTFLVVGQRVTGERSDPHTTYTREVAMAQ